MRRVPKKTKRWTGATKCTTDIRKREDPSVETVSEDAAAGSSARFSGTAAGTKPMMDASSITVTVDNLPVIRSVKMSVSSSEQSEEDVPKRQWSFERSISMTESQPGPSQEFVEIPSRSRERSSTPNKVEGHGDSVLNPPPLQSGGKISLCQVTRTFYSQETAIPIGKDHGIRVQNRNDLSAGQEKFPPDHSCIRDRQHGNRQERSS